MLRTCIIVLLLAVGHSQQQCGVPAIAPNTDPNCDDTRIVGGCEAVPYSWPWQIDFSKVYPSGLGLICGGAVIAADWVMTAAHCVYGNEDNPDGFRVVAGVFDRWDTNATGAVVAQIEKIYINPRFNQRTFEYDISLLKLVNPLPMTDHISPVCLPESDDGLIVDGDVFWVTGWGTLHGWGGLVDIMSMLPSDVNMPDDLHQVWVPALNQSECDAEYGASNINDACMLCAGRSGEDSCQGDSGGPLVKQQSDGSWYQYGIVSWGYGCAERGHAGVYSRVTAYCDWIAQVSGDAAQCRQPPTHSYRR